MVNAVAGEYDPATGEMLHPTVVLHVPRRAGKTADILAQLARRVLGQPRSQSWYTAQTGGDAGTTFRREWLPILRASGLARRLKVSLRAGAESFDLVERGASATCFAPVESALHGRNVDLAIIDEAWAHDADAGHDVELAVFPAQLTRPGAQTWIVSAGGTLASVWLDGWLERAEACLAAGDPSIALFEWSADAEAPDYDPTSPATWWTAHPALGDTVTEAAIRRELDRAGLADFERSILNVWPRPRNLATGIDAAGWARLADLDLAGPATAAAFDVTPDRSNAALAAAGPARDGRTVVEVLDYRRGVGWLDASLKAWSRAHPGAPIVCDALGAGTIADRLEMAGLEVLRVGAGQLARACADLLDQVTAGTVAHRAQEVLDAAIAGAGRRPIGDAGWAWSRRHSDTDISPLVAATLAAWSARSRPAPPAPFVAVAR
jgi:phage terminase large subunit-like protein